MNNDYVWSVPDYFYAYASKDKLSGTVPNIIRRSRMAMPQYFTRRMESFLDVCFLVLPTLIVILILLPTLGFLYSHEFMFTHTVTSMSIDVIGHQWYWSYEYNLGGSIDAISFAFDSILDVDAIENRNLEVDRRMVIPTDVFISVTITSTDVIHS